jgi:hypothetical protein
MGVENRETKVQRDVSSLAGERYLLFIGSIEVHHPPPYSLAKVDQVPFRKAREALDCIPATLREFAHVLIDCGDIANHHYDARDRSHHETFGVHPDQDLGTEPSESPRDGVLSCSSRKCR